MPDTPDPDPTALEQKAKKTARKFILMFAAIFAMVPCFILLRERHLLSVIDRVAWRKVGCEILSAKVERTASDPWHPYEPKIKYRYVLDGVSLESESVGEARYALYDEARATAERTLRSRNYCYVGGKPRQSVLFRFSEGDRFDLLFDGGFLLLSIILVAGQFIIRTVEGLRMLRSAAVAILFVFVGSLGGEMTFTMLKGIWKTSRAKSWPQMPCTVILSVFQKDRSDGNMIYRPDILYRYDLEGRSFVSSRVDFFQEGLAEPHQELLEKFPAQSDAVCYVNPSNPAESVLAPAWSRRHLLFAAFGMFITGMGGGVLWLFFWPHKLKQQQFTPATTETVLKPATNRWPLLFSAVFCIAMNAAVGGQLFSSAQFRPGLKWIPWIVLLGMNAFLLKIALPWLKPIFLRKAILRLPRNHLVRGGDTTISWELPKNTKSFELILICVEWRKDTDGFKEPYNETIFSGKEPVQEGHALLTLPETAPQSHWEKGHVIDWAFKVRLNSGTWRSLESLYGVRVV
jgi:hypothetical protein